MNKASFILYTEYAEQIAMLNDAQAAAFLRAVFAYASGSELPEMDGMTMMLFSMVRRRMDQDAERYAEVVEKRAEAGKKGGRPKAEEKANGSSEKAKKANGFSEEAKKANGFSEKQKNPDTDTDYDTDTVTDTVSDTVTSNVGKRESTREKRQRFTAPTIDQVKAYCLERHNKVDPERFVNYYESNGWKVGKNPMRDWKAAVRTWETNGNDSPPTTRSGTGNHIDYLLSIARGEHEPSGNSADYSDDGSLFSAVL